MNELEPNALSDELREALRADFSPSAPGARERLTARLATSVGALALSVPAAAATPAAPNAMVPASTTLRAALAAHPLAFAVTFALGCAVGGGLHAAVRAPPATQATQHELSANRPPANAPRTSPPEQPPIAAVPPLQSASQPVESHSAAVPRPTASISDGLAAQQALLDQARSAFMHEDFADALQKLELHTARYPRSALTEEREALRVKALVGAQRFEEARRLGASFAARFPQSLLLPSVQDSLGRIP